MNRKVFSIGLIFSLMLFATSLEAASEDLSKIEKLEKRLETLEKREREWFKKGESEIRVYFKNGFKMRSLDNNFKFQAG
ncbi:MAG: hypothetical protein H8E42_01470, partial [Nitrospinae bacterium]|nr:hypothetical protein [Nitrospinota bacterium]